MVAVITILLVVAIAGALGLGGFFLSSGMSLVEALSQPSFLILTGMIVFAFIFNTYVGYQKSQQKNYWEFIRMRMLMKRARKK